MIVSQLCHKLKEKLINIVQSKHNFAYINQPNYHFLIKVVFFYISTVCTLVSNPTNYIAKLL
jgi:hypothetical protein